MRIGELARAAGMTPRTVRYYEEIGLLPEAGERTAGAHREYGDEDLERLRELVRLKHMLGLSLDELRDVMHGEDERAQRRREWQRDDRPGGAAHAPARPLGHIGRAAGARRAPQGGARDASRPSSTSAASGSRTCCANLVHR